MAIWAPCGHMGLIWPYGGPMYPLTVPYVAQTCPVIGYPPPLVPKVTHKNAPYLTLPYYTPLNLTLPTLPHLTLPYRPLPNPTNPQKPRFYYGKTDIFEITLFRYETTQEDKR